MQYTYWEFFSTAPNSFWTRWFWCLLLLVPFFVLSFPHWQNVPLWEHFSSGETNKKVTRGEIRWIGRVWHGNHAVFSQKLLNTQYSVGRCTHKSPIMKWVNVLKESSKKFTEALAGVAQWTEHWIVKQRVAGSIPSQCTCLGCRPGPQWGAYKKQPHKRQPHSDVSLPLSSFPLCLKINK